MCETGLPRTRTISQIVRFVRVGLASNFAGYAVYLVMTAIGVPSKIAMTVLYSIGAVFGYLGNRRYTFSHDERGLGPWIRYAVTHAIGYGINLSLLLYLSDRAGWAHQGVQAIAVVVVAIYLFLMSKYFVFKTR